LAHGLDLIIVSYQAANRNVTLSELRYHESHEFAGRAYRHDFGSVAHHALIPHQSRGTLTNGQPPEAASETTQWLAKSKVVSPRTVKLGLKFRLFFKKLHHYPKMGFAVNTDDEQTVPVQG